MGIEENTNGPEQTGILEMCNHPEDKKSYSLMMTEREDIFLCSYMSSSVCACVFLRLSFLVLVYSLYTLTLYICIRQKHVLSPKKLYQSICGNIF